MTVTLHWLIKNSQLNNLKIIVGNQQLNRKITSVNVLDNPDVLKWFKKNELILATGYIFKDDPELQRNIIREMKETGCAALAIKVKRFFRTIPEPLLEEAKKLDFPIIELPFFYGFSEITQVIYKKLYAEEQQAFYTEQDFLSKLSNAFFSHKDITSQLKILTEFFHTSFILTDLSFGFLAASFTDSKESTLPSDLAEKISRQPQPQKLSSFTMHIDGTTLFASILPNHIGYLFHISTTEAAPAENLLGKAVQLIALSCEQNNIAKRSYENRRHFFLHFLLHQTHGREPEIKNICTFYGFNFHKAWICASFSLPPGESEQKRQKIAIFLQEQLKQQAPGQDIFLCKDDNIFCVFFFFPREAEIMASVHCVQQIFTWLQTQAKEQFQILLPAGISRFCHQLKDLQLSFKDSLQTLNLQQKLGKPAPGSYLHQLPYHLLANSGEDTLVQIKSMLNPLLAFDQSNHTELVRTLQTYYQCKFNSSEAAKLLYLHRNTMLNRIEKIKEILHTDLADMEENMLLYLSLCSISLDKKI